jgi:hypothetical protein
VRGNTTLKKQAFLQLVDIGVLIESGDGVKDSPYIYRHADVPDGL